MGVRRKFIRDLAEKLLAKHCPNGAPVQVEVISGHYGIELKLERVDDDLSGFLYRDDSGHAIIGVNRNHHENRRRFTIAHELGHFLLHEAERVHLDSRTGGYALQLRSPESATGENVNEREANLFAAEILMPATFLEKDLRSHNLDLLDDDEKGLKILKSLAKKYKVSSQALTIRLNNLGYIHHEA
jgi:Zn-dependent peptidase ImmA (M78 family)